MSLNKAEQARINGAKSRGPKTEAGKRKSAMNACKHGLSSKLVVQHNEDDKQFQLLLAAFIEKFQPADPVEHELVFEAAAARFQLRRAWALETATLDRQMEDQRDTIDRLHPVEDEETRLAVAFETLSNQSNTLNLLNRYHSRIRRDYEKAIRDLEHMRASRTLTQPKLPNEPRKPAAPALRSVSRIEHVQPNEPRMEAIFPNEPKIPLPHEPAAPAFWPAG